MTGPSSPAVAEELPPFSFSKKPILNTIPASAIPHNINRTLLNEPKPADVPTFNNINYDDQIRAPRMSLATHYTYEPELPRPFTDRKNSTTPNPLLKGDLFQLQEEGSQYSVFKDGRLENSLRALDFEDKNCQGLYRPATADLTQPSRRNLEPVKQKWGIIVSVGNILSLDTDGYPEISGTCEDPGSNSTVLGDSAPLMQQKLKRAIDNLDSNVTLEERCADAEGASCLIKPTRGRNRVYVPSEGPAIQQVYTQKKPLCLPAVLRPPQEIDKINEEDFHHELSEHETSPEARLSEYPFEVPQEDSFLMHARAEPTHEHWIPNSSSDHCMNCFETFRGFFYPQKRGRHHCRFCGLLYCQNCLYKSREPFQITPPAGDSNTLTRTNSGSSNSSSVRSSLSAVSSNFGDDGVDGVMLDSKARIVIPIFKNLTGSGMGIASLHQKFKPCKLCKTCGHISLRLLYMLNHRSRVRNDIDAPYVFIDNPYIGESHAPQAHPLYDLKARAPGSGSRVQASGERRPSYNNVPSDWTWSSF